MTVNRLLIVSNRLPITASLDGEGLRLMPASGGLATGLGPWRELSVFTNADGALWKVVDCRQTSSIGRSKSSP